MYIYYDISGKFSCDSIWNSNTKLNYKNIYNSVCMGSSNGVAYSKKQWISVSFFGFMVLTRSQLYSVCSSVSVSCFSLPEELIYYGVFGFISWRFILFWIGTNYILYFSHKIILIYFIYFNVIITFTPINFLLRF